MRLGPISGKEPEKDIVLEKFKDQISKAGLLIDFIDDDGQVHISKNGLDIVVNLDNTRKMYERLRNDACITALVDVITADPDVFFSWETVKKDVYLSLFPSDFDFQNIVNQKVTEDFNKVYVVKGGGRLTWVKKSDLEAWSLTEQELDKVADINGNKLLERASLRFDILDEKKLGYFDTEEEAFKATLLFASGLKEKVIKEFGWPIYAVIPVRDFCYIFSEADFDYFSNELGEVASKEYKRSANPITSELLKISDGGVTVVKKYVRKR